MTKRDDSTEEAKKWLEAHRAALADTPEDIQLIPRADGDDGSGPQVASETLPHAPKVSSKDAPSDYDWELGRVVEPDPVPSSEVSRAMVEHWVRLATDIIRQIGPTSSYGPFLPVARLPDLEKLPELNPRVLDALPELEALHRKLCWGWRSILLGWFEQRAKVNIESKFRPLGERKRGRLTNALPERQPLAPRDLLASMRANRELIGDIPEGLTVEILTYLGERASLRQGGKGHTPGVCVRLAETYARNPDQFAAMQADAQQIHKRRQRRRKRRDDS